MRSMNFRASRFLNGIPKPIDLKGSVMHSQDMMKLAAQQSILTLIQKVLCRKDTSVTQSIE